jgi:hypothetical protein
MIDHKEQLVAFLRKHRPGVSAETFAAVVEDLLEDEAAGPEFISLLNDWEATYA